MELRHHRKLINSTNAGSDCVTLFDVLEHTGLIHSTYHEVTEYQIWFPFVKGLVGYNIFLDDKSLIPISPAHHLTEICNDIRSNLKVRNFSSPSSSLTHDLGRCSSKLNIMSLVLKVHIHDL